MTDLLERLRAVGCDREPFTPDHANCICRVTHRAADELEELRKLKSGEAVPFPVSRKHAAAMHLVAERYLKDNELPA